MAISSFVRIVATGNRASAADETYDVQTNGHSGIIVVVDVTADGGAFSQTVSLLGVDPASGKTWPLLDGAAMTSLETQVLQVHPSLTAETNAKAQELLPATIRISIAHTDDTQITRTISLQLVS